MKSAFLLTLAFITTGLGAQTSTWKIDPSHSSVKFQVRNLAISTAHGTMNGVNGTVILDENDITKSSVIATTEASTVSTGNESRDKHLRSDDFFNVEMYPQIVFKSTSLTREGNKLKMTGDFSLAGVTRSVTLEVDGPTASLTDANGVTRSDFSAKGVLSRKNFQFGLKNTTDSAMIGDEVKFTINVEIDKQ